MSQGEGTSSSHTRSRNACNIQYPENLSPLLDYETKPLHFCRIMDTDRGYNMKIQHNDKKPVRGNQFIAMANGNPNEDLCHRKEVSTQLVRVVLDEMLDSSSTGTSGCSAGTAAPREISKKASIGAQRVYVALELYSSHTQLSNFQPRRTLGSQAGKRISITKTYENTADLAYLIQQ
ncbi:hypothetical protein BC629DRAFT_1725094 [Irpex lacteus]|nr:hypothetical protein BC629DRAFT_1725094 [Irpex lacteus]